MSIPSCFKLSIIVIGVCKQEIFSTIQSIPFALNCPQVQIVVVLPSDVILDFPIGLNFEIVHDQKLGIYPAMNAGILASKGDFLWFLNSGDHSAFNSGKDFINFLGLLDSSEIQPKLFFCSRSLFDSVKFFNCFSKSNLQKFLRLVFVLQIFPVSHQNIIYPSFWHPLFSQEYKLSADFFITYSLILCKHVDITIYPDCIAINNPDGVSNFNRFEVLSERYSASQVLYKSPVLSTCAFFLRLVYLVITVIIKRIISLFPWCTPWF